MGKKKEKITYIDDGRTIADMSALPGGHRSRPAWTPRASLKEQWQTYWSAVKMLFLPMLCVVGAMALVYVLMYVLFSAM